jgi:hypothetical protein
MNIIWYDSECVHATLEETSTLWRRGNFISNFELWKNIWYICKIKKSNEYEKNWNMIIEK